MFGKLLKSELYRASKYKCVYILLVVLFFLSTFMNLVLLKFDFVGMFGDQSEMMSEMLQEGNSQENMENIAQLETQLNTGNTTPSSNNILGKGIYYKEAIPTIFYMQVSNLNSILVIAIFVGIFTGDTINTGITKNLVLCNNKRNVLFAARVTAIAIYSAIVHVATWLFSLIGIAMWGESIKLELTAAHLIYFLVTLFMTIAFATIVYAITFIAKSKAAGITIGVVLSTGALSTVITLVNWMVVRKFDVDTDFNVGNYMLTQNFTIFNNEFERGDLIRAIVVALVYGGLAVMAVLATNKKRDLA